MLQESVFAHCGGVPPLSAEGFLAKWFSVKGVVLKASLRPINVWLGPSLHLDHPQPCEMISFFFLLFFYIKEYSYIVLCMYCAQFTYSLSVRPINVWPPPQSPPSSTTPTPPSPPSSFLRGKLSTRTYCSRRKWRWFIKKKKMFYWNPTIICHCHSFSNFPASA